MTWICNQCKRAEPHVEKAKNRGKCVECYKKQKRNIYREKVGALLAPAEPALMGVDWDEALCNRALRGQL